MDNFFNGFEADVCELFKLYHESRREEIQEKLRIETEEKQAKMEAVELKKWEKK